MSIREGLSAFWNSTPVMLVRGIGTYVAVGLGLLIGMGLIFGIMSWWKS